MSRNSLGVTVLLLTSLLVIPMSAITYGTDAGPTDPRLLGLGLLVLVLVAVAGWLMLTDPNAPEGDIETFEGSDLNSDRWLPHYLPHWSSRIASRATYRVADSVLRLSIPTTQGLWCGDRHQPPLRTSTIVSALPAATLGSTSGQQPFADGLTVTEEQDEFRGWVLPASGHLHVRARAHISPRSMVSVWLTGLEDEPEHSGEVCVFEIFGDTRTRTTGTTGTTPTAGVGAGLHSFRDPELAEDFAVTPVPLDLAEWHDFAVEYGPHGCRWTVDDEPLRATSSPAPTYPLQVLIGVFDFPSREAGETAHHEPWFEVDELSLTP